MNVKLTSSRLRTCPSAPLVRDIFIIRNSPCFNNELNGTE